MDLEDVSSSRPGDARLAPIQPTSKRDCMTRSLKVQSWKKVGSKRRCLMLIAMKGCVRSLGRACSMKRMAESILSLVFSATMEMPATSERVKRFPSRKPSTQWAKNRATRWSHAFMTGSRSLPAVLPPSFSLIASALSMTMSQMLSGCDSTGRPSGNAFNTSGLLRAFSSCSTVMMDFRNVQASISQVGLRRARWPPWSTRSSPGRANTLSSHVSASSGNKSASSFA
mmetsp:Transcript_55098/g.160795  ORF Transcript_55098/g.160795 Transcript_55098/m.160795 type:complete len:227 (-) Transcript_55098:1062-1742(-)